MTCSIRSIALLLATAAAIFGATRAAATEPNSSEAKAWRVGTEVDALPFASSGYYGSLFAAREGWKVRAVAARSDIPSFMVSDGFRDKSTDAYALLADRFVGCKRYQLQGLWVGGGVEQWRNRIRRDGATEYAHYNNTMLTVGGGYVWQFSRHFYLNPWAAGHFAVSGDRNIPVAGKIYKQSVFVPEGSVKLGFIW